ncbi:hypothetical protein IQ07DRAFT_20256 [Pyrenochaeta sp. DS3sAY3a]|nr:hypothetical protein IQ07DRAFT_20256 [Pyrenochaeta sp. DS3sAY3a]
MMFLTSIKPLRHNFPEYTSSHQASTWTAYIRKVLQLSSNRRYFQREVSTQISNILEIAIHQKYERLNTTITMNTTNENPTAVPTAPRADLEVLARSLNYSRQPPSTNGPSTNAQPPTEAAHPSEPEDPAVPELPEMPATLAELVASSEPEPFMSPMEADIFYARSQENLLTVLPTSGTIINPRETWDAWHSAPSGVDNTIGQTMIRDILTEADEVKAVQDAAWEASVKMVRFQEPKVPEDVLAARRPDESGICSKCEFLHCFGLCETKEEREEVEMEKIKAELQKRLEKAMKESKEKAQARAQAQAQASSSKITPAQASSSSQPPQAQSASSSNRPPKSAPKVDEWWKKEPWLMEILARKNPQEYVDKMPSGTQAEAKAWALATKMLRDIRAMEAKP